MYKHVYKGKNVEELEDTALDFGDNEASTEKVVQMNSQEQSLEAEEETPPRAQRKRGRPKKSPLEKQLREEPPVKKRNQPDRKAKNSSSALNVHARPVQDTSFAFFATRELKLDKVQFLDWDEEGHIDHNLEEDELKFALIASVNKDPTSYKEAMNSPNKLEWSQAVTEELESMYVNDVWDIIERSKIEDESRRLNVIDSKWVFKRKTDGTGQTNFKARLVIRGFKDRKEYELKETYAPVSRLAVVRSALAVINKMDLEVCQMDVKTAFLNGTLENDIYMKIPEGIDCSEVNQETHVCKLKKSLYGLKISPKRWNERFTQEVKRLGLEHDINEPCLFTWRLQGKMALIVLYVDDLLLASNDTARLNEIKRELSKAFQMKDLGEPDIFLGMKITRDRRNRVMTLSQTEYTEKILERFNLKDSAPHDTPMVTRKVKNQEMRKLEDSEKSGNSHTPKVPFREAIGSLLYLASATRPDIAYAVCTLARRQFNPTERDWEKVIRVFKYLRGTTTLGLRYRGESEVMSVMTDTSLLDCEGSKSTSGYAIKVYGDTVSWRSHKQRLVTQSSCDAEYLALSESCSGVISLDKALRDMVGKSFYTVTIYCDNQSALDNSRKESSHKLIHHDESILTINENLAHREQTGNRKTMSDAHGDFVKQCIKEKRVLVRKINTKDKIADIFTKPLDRGDFGKHRASLLN